MNNYMDIDYSSYDVIIVGCGLSGAVMAERFSQVLNKRVLILERRSHIGGNCYDFLDEETKIMCNKYGPHLFHTNDEIVWGYINKFSEWERYEHKVIGNIGGKTFPIPVNITTVNLLCGENIKTSTEMECWLKENQQYYDNITNGEEMARSLVGDSLYKKIFKNYTFKQWGKYPEELSPEVLNRIPIRRDFDDRYFTDKYQVLPKCGYTGFFEKMLAHKNIDVMLNIDYLSIKDSIPLEKIVVYTGPIDRYFSDSGYEKLEYRSLNIVFEKYKDMNYYQPSAQVNYTGDDEKFTRIIEYKHFLNQVSSHTVISKEYSSVEGEPYYPVLNNKNKELFNKYKGLAEKEALYRNIHFVGRLANYKYFNMDEAIKNALNYFNEIFKSSL